MTASGKIKNQIERDKFYVSLVGDNILKIVVKENVEFEAEDVIRLQEAKFELIGNKKHGVLFVSPHTGIMTKEAREKASSEIANKNALAKAVVFHNLGMRIFSNFFIKFNKPLVEHKIFQNESDAMDWLLQKCKS